MMQTEFNQGWATPPASPYDELMTSRRSIRRIWVTGCNLVCIALMSVSFVRDYEMSHLGGGTPFPRPLLDRLGPLIPIFFLLLGTIFEWIDWNWLALTINVGFFAFFGLATLGTAATIILTNSSQDRSEIGEAVGIVGIPCTVVAITDLYLYWTSGLGRATTRGDR
jgi:hypothetical protein